MGLEQVSFGRLLTFIASIKFTSRINLKFVDFAKKRTEPSVFFIFSRPTFLWRRELDYVIPKNVFLLSQVDVETIKSKKISCFKNTQSRTLMKTGFFRLSVYFTLLLRKRDAQGNLLHMVTILMFCFQENKNQWRSFILQGRRFIYVERWNLLFERFSQGNNNDF